MLGHSFFTFHNVSINTGRSTDSWTSQCSLHSTMFLLIPVAWNILLQRKRYFTFHNVSINTIIKLRMEHSFQDFTFHNVSINTHCEWLVTMTLEDLYIPQCFY